MPGRDPERKRRGGPDESGTALVGTTVGFLIVMVLLLSAVQVVLRLYATSAVTSAATEAAQQVASSPDPQSAVAGAEALARSDLGSTPVSFAWEEVDADRVVLEVSVPSPVLLPLVPGAGPIHRTVTVRTERFR